MPKQKWQWAVFLRTYCTKELSPENYVLVKEGGTSNYILAPSLSAGLSLSLFLSLSLSNNTRIYWNVVEFAFQTQYIRGLFVRNNIDTSLLICTLYSIFYGNLTSLQWFKYSQCFDKYDLNSTFHDKICRKSLFTVFATCETGSDLPVYGVILYAQ